MQLHLAVLLFGGTALFAKLIDLPALDIMVYRSLVAAIVLCILLISRKKPLKLNSVKDYIIALLLGGLMGWHWVTYFSGMQLAGITIALFSYPVITVLLKPLFYKSQPQFKNVISGLVVVFSIYLLIPEASLGNQVTLGGVVGIISAFLFSLRNIIHKKYFTQYSGRQTMMYQALIASVILCVFVEVPPTQVNLNDWWLVLLVGVFFTALSHSLFTASLRNLLATTVGLISCLQVFYGSVFAFAVLAEQAALTTILGRALVVSASFFETWSVRKKQSHNI